MDDLQIEDAVIAERVRCLEIVLSFQDDRMLGKSEFVASILREIAKRIDSTIKEK